MPELSRFNGMVIYMQFYDTKHHKTSPHIHVYYGDFEASVGIDGELMAGSLPRKQLVFIQAWLALHEEEAYAAWNRAVQGEHFEKDRAAGLTGGMIECMNCNGIVYAGNPTPMKEVIYAGYRGNYMIRVAFNTGEVVDVNIYAWL